MTWLANAAATVLIASAGAALVQAKSVTDVVVMKNGDKLTGEVKKLENGFLYFKPAYAADTIQIDWRRVERLESRDPFNVTLSDGTRATGLIKRDSETEPDAQGFSIRSRQNIKEVRVAEVVTLTPVEDTFWRQLTGSLNYGFSFTGGTNTTQSSFSGDLGYRAERWAFKVDGSSVINRQSGAANSGRNTADLYYFRYRGDRWFIAGTSSFLNSQQQDLTARTTFGSGIGWDLIRSPTTSLQVVAGALLNNERYAPASGTESGRGADSQFLVQYSKYAFTKFQFISELGVFPSLTTPGRVRMSTQSSVKRELFRNFNLVFSVYENFDSHPPVRAPKNDFGTSTSIGWSY